MLSAIAASTGGIGHAHHAEGAEGEGDRVGDREACDRDQDSAARAGDEHEAHKKQEMVVAFEDVSDAQREVVARHAAEALDRGNDDLGLFG